MHTRWIIQSVFSLCFLLYNLLRVGNREMVPLDVVLCFLFRRERVEPEAIRVIDLYAILASAMQDPKLGKSRGASDLSDLRMSQPVLLLLSGHNHKVGRAVVLLYAEYRVPRGDKFPCIFDFGHFLFLHYCQNESLFFLAVVVKICTLARKHIVG